MNYYEVNVSMASIFYGVRHRVRMTGGFSFWLTWKEVGELWDIIQNQYYVPVKDIL